MAKHFFYLSAGNIEIDYLFQSFYKKYPDAQFHCYDLSIYPYLYDKEIKAGVNYMNQKTTEEIRENNKEYKDVSNETLYNAYNFDKPFLGSDFIAQNRDHGPILLMYYAKKSIPAMKFVLEIDRHFDLTDYFTNIERVRGTLTQKTSDKQKEINTLPKNTAMLEKYILSEQQEQQKQQIINKIQEINTKYNQGRITYNTNYDRNNYENYYEDIRNKIDKIGPDNQIIIWDGYNLSSDIFPLAKKIIADNEHKNIKIIKGCTCCGIAICNTRGNILNKISSLDLLKEANFTESDIEILVTANGSTNVGTDPELLKKAKQENQNPEDFIYKQKRKKIDDNSENLTELGNILDGIMKYTNTDNLKKQYSSITFP